MENKNALDSQDRSYMVSNVRDELAYKYTMKSLLPFLDALKRSKDTLIAFAQFLVCCAIVAYFGAHFIVYLAGVHTTTTPSVVVVNHRVITLKK